MCFFWLLQRLVGKEITKEDRAGVEDLHVEGEEEVNHPAMQEEETRENVPNNQTVHPGLQSAPSGDIARLVTSLMVILMPGNVDQVVTVLAGLLSVASGDIVS